MIMGERTLFGLILFSLIIVVYCDHCLEKEFNTLRCDYIPEDIPAGISTVKIVDFNDKNTHINSSYFQTENWGKVKYMELHIKSSELMFFSHCFSGLKILKTLKIHVIGYINHLDSDVFLGLDHVKTLDLSDCTRVSLKKIIPALLGSEKLPRLQELLLSNFGNNRYASVFDSSFSQAVKGKNITHLDVSKSQISLFDFTAVTEDLNHLKILNLSYSVVSDTSHKGNKVSDLTSIDIIDISHTVFPKAWVGSPFGNIIISNYTLKSNITPRGHLKLIFAAKVINATGIVSKPNSLWIENCKANFDQPNSWHTKRLIARNNNIKRLDVQVYCSKYNATNFEHVDLAYNGLEFIHPSILACLPNISKLNLSGNQLFRMVKESSRFFQKIFQSLKHLFWVSLSRNNLVIIPKNMFESNFELQEIDLSDNKLKHIAFSLFHLKKLRFLDLRGNQLRVLDDKSIRTLDSIHQTFNQKQDNFVVLLGNNPFSCSTCRTKRSIQWLTTTTLLNITSQQLTCSDENGTNDIITADTLKMILKICRRETVIISLSTSAGVLVLIICVAILAIYKRKKYSRKMAKLENVLRNLNEGQDHFEFVTFLSYSSEDKDFVDTYVFHQLNENLKIKTGLERNLVCTGDEYLRPGFMILDETVRCIERASVMVVVLSSNYCVSRYCHQELDQAYRLNKPIILMLKEHVDEERMMPTMKLLFKNNVRILWETENEEYVLKTTWENVCTSILDLIVNSVHFDK